MRHHLLLLFLLSAGCGGDATQITVQVRHDAPVPERFTLELSAWREGSPQRITQTHASPVLPATLALVPEGGALGTVIAEAKLTAEGQTRTLRSRATFVEGENIPLLLDFSPNSSPDAGTDAGVTTPDGSFPSPDSGIPTPDGGIPTPDAGPPAIDAGTDAGAPSGCGPLEHDGRVLNASLLASMRVPGPGGEPTEVLAVFEQHRCNATSGIPTCVRLYHRTGTDCFEDASAAWEIKPESLQLTPIPTGGLLAVNDGATVWLRPIGFMSSGPVFQGAENTGISGQNAFAGISGNHFAIANQPTAIVVALRNAGWHHPGTLPTRTALDTWGNSILSTRENILEELRIAPFGDTDTTLSFRPTKIPGTAPDVAVLGHNHVFAANAGASRMTHCTRDGTRWGCNTTDLPGPTPSSLSQSDIDGANNHWAMRANAGANEAVFHGNPRDPQRLILEHASGDRPPFAVLHDGVAYIGDMGQVHIVAR